MSFDPPASGSFPQAPEPPSMVGTVLADRFKVLKKLGEGGMGEVYACEHVHIEKRLAVKLLKSEITSNTEAVKRFFQEARSSSSIKHRNIIGIEDFGHLPDGRIYMAMELLNGAPLNEMIQQPMSADRLLNILIQAGHGLAAAHAKGIIHRDMKPENIFVTQEGNPPNDVPKLLDFGIAKVAGNEGQNNLTRTGTIFGTPFYMAPEQALGNPVDARTDVYAMGVIMYECFSGTLPFQGESFMGILTQHITTPPENVSQRAAKAGRSLPMGVAEIIMKCLDKDPNMRFQTMDELVNALIQVYRGIAGPGMSTYMEAFPVGVTGHHNAPTPPPMTGAHYAAHQSQPVMPVQGHGHAPTGQGAALGTPLTPLGGSATASGSGLYDPAGSSVVAVPKRGNTGVIIAILILLAAGGGIAAVVMLGGKKDKKDDVAQNGSGSADVVTPDKGSAGGTTPVTPDKGSNQVAVNDKGSAGGSTNDTTNNTPPDDKGSATTPPDDKGSATTTPPDDKGSATTPPDDKGSGAGNTIGGAINPDLPKPKNVLLLANADTFEVWENGKKLMDGPENVEVVPGTTRTLTLKARGYKDKVITVDGKQGKVKTKLARLPGQTTTTTNTGTTQPPKQDCSQKIIDPGSAVCRQQYCKSHKSDPRCETLDDD